MNLLVVLTFSALIAISCQNVVKRPEEYLLEWEDYKTLYNKHYSNEEDRAKALNFIQKRRLIDNHNNKYARGEVSYRMGVNQFTDMTEEETAGFKGLLPLTTHNTIVRTPASSEKLQDDIPASKDWNKLGYVSPVEFEGNCSSFYSFVTASLIESHYAIKNNLTNNVVRLSKQQIVDCSRNYGNSGCAGGYFQHALDYLKEGHGLEKESNYPYKTVEGKCEFNASEVVASIRSYRQLQDDEDLIRREVAFNGPVAVAIVACTSFKFYAGGIYEDSNCGKSEVGMNHAVVITGYGTSKSGKDFWIVKNSWGNWWGEKGFGKIVRGQRAIGIGMQSFVPKM